LFGFGYAFVIRQHFLYFLPLPQGQDWFRPIFGSVLLMVSTGS